MGLGTPGMLVLSICAMKLKRLHGANLELMGTREKTSVTFGTDYIYQHNAQTVLCDMIFSMSLFHQSNMVNYSIESEAYLPILAVRLVFFFLIDSTFTVFSLAPFF